ncbi:MAG: lipopolysaccharide heptosyltransferase II [Betaproteobacteria bacterium AqS2]|uniref:lipopolysaccharide heptosyltransferase II n=1 Tax=Candidatus Amphirhobacter heronislandensis TaxID=1732024 RepID=A0A930XWD2_9GAMM|nr:lipopolysaccharide heptosyltransferase II [Betaproteobacteria bacterium AqS2]
MAGPILIVGDRGIGDMVLAHGLLQALRAQEPDSPIDVVATPANAAVAELFPEVRTTLVLENRPGRLDLGRRLALLREVKQGGYAQAFVLRHYLKDALLPWLARIPRRVGWHGGEGRHLLLTDALPNSGLPAHRARQLAALAHPAGAEFELLEPRLAVPAAGEEELRNKQPELAAASDLAALCPGGVSPRGKQWPAAAYAKVADWLAARDLRPVIVGAAADREQARQIIAAASAKEIADMTGGLSLPASLALLARCRVLVSNDTGLMHAGAALGITTLGVFVKTEPATWSPVGANAHWLAPASAADAIAKLERII